MSQDTAAFLDPEATERFESYRAVSKAAVLSVCLGLVSLLGFLFTSALSLALVGLLCGIVAYQNIRRYPEELTGRIPAILGTALCGLVLVSGFARQYYVYATEVPDGYQRVSFEILKADSKEPDVPPSEALHLDGKQVFLKGYMYPDGQSAEIKRFVLVPDLGTCCFGGQPKLTHMVEVTLEDPLRVHYRMGKKFGLAGTLRVDRALKPVSGLGGVYYQLTAQYVK